MKEYASISISRSDYLSVISGRILTCNSSPIDEIKLVNRGLTSKWVMAFANLMHWELYFFAKLLGTTKGSLIINKNKRLSKQISENAIEIAKLSELGVRYFGSVDNWNIWLRTPNLQLNGMPPSTIIGSIRGRESIKNIINRLKFGFTA